MRSLLTLLFLLVFLLLACREEVSIDELDAIVADGDFKVEALYCSGLAGWCPVTYIFQNQGDAITLDVRVHCGAPSKIDQSRFSKSEFEAIKEEINCLKDAHEVDVEPSCSCILGASNLVYRFQSTFKEVRLVTSHGCEFEVLLETFEVEN